MYNARILDDVASSLHNLLYLKKVEAWVEMIWEVWIHVVGSSVIEGLEKLSLGYVEKHKPEGFI